MKKQEKKIINILLGIIVVCSIILIIRILISRKYDQELYNEVYSEYNRVFGDETNTNTNNRDIENDSSIEANTVVEDESAEQELESIISDSNYLDNNTRTTRNGTKYSIIASIFIPKIEISYPIISETSDELLKIAPCKFTGVEPNEVGNLSIIGHNYRNVKFFSRINTLENGDIVELESLSKRKVKYKVYDKFEVAKDDFSAVVPTTNGTMDLTLITCTNYNKAKRFILKCRANI